jgi:hypothetical protein
MMMIGKDPAMFTRTDQAAVVNYRFRDHPAFAWSQPQKVIFNNTSQMVSNGHYGWQTDTGFDNGGPFYLKKDLQSHSLGRYTSSTFEGDFACGNPIGFTNPFNSYTVPSNSTLDAKGTTAIARTEPTNAVADVAAFIGELRSDGIPRLRPEILQAQTKRARAAGSDYLNVEFGWLPLVSDLKKFAYAVTNSHEILENYHKHGRGQKIRRRYAFPTLSETWSAERTDFLPIPNSSALGFGRGTIAIRRQQDMWFAGAFRYHVPVGDSTLEKFRSFRSDAQKLLGVDITPEVVWEVSPWSWLVDWQTNTGDVLHNISSMGRDGLVLQYGYMMCHTLFEGTRSARFGAAGYASATVTSDTKIRRPATPYGFGVDPLGLTAKQSAILAALGLSRR